MRVRMVGIIVGAAVLWAVAPLSASAVGCEANTDASIAVPGDSSASARSACSVSGAQSAALDVSAREDQQSFVTVGRATFDANGDGGESSIAIPVHVSCPPPDEQGVVSGLSCFALQVL